MGKCAVIGDEQQPFGILIQPPNREKPFALTFGEQGKHGFMQVVHPCADQPRRLVEHIIAPYPPAHRLPAKKQHILYRGDFMRRITDNLPIDADPPRTYGSTSLFPAAAPK